MNRVKNKLSTPEMVCDFINVCSKYENCDINIYDESNIIDGKSIIGVFAITNGKQVEVKAISSDESAVLSFAKDIKKFEVKE